MLKQPVGYKYESIYSVDIKKKIQPKTQPDSVSIVNIKICFECHFDSDSSAVFIITVLSVTCLDILKCFSLLLCLCKNFQVHKLILFTF